MTRNTAVQSTSGHPTNWAHFGDGQVWVMWDEESATSTATRRWIRVDFFHDLGDLAAGDRAQSLRLSDEDVSALIMFLEEYQERTSPRASQVPEPFRGTGAAD